MLPEIEAYVKYLLGDSLRIPGLDEAIARVFPRHSFSYGGDFGYYYCFELRLAICKTYGEGGLDEALRRLCEEHNSSLLEIPSGLSFEQMVERIRAFSDDV